MFRLPTLNQIDAAMEGSVSRGVRIFLCTEVTDLRRGFDRLAEMVRESLRQDPLSGNLFVFRNRSGEKLKIFYWDEDGFCIWYKRLEEGTFRFPATPVGTGAIEVRASELAMLLEGIDLRSIRRVKRFKTPQKS